MKKLGCLVIFVVLGVVMYMTNPSQKEHIDNAYKILREKGIEKFGINANYLAVGEGLLGKEQMDELLSRFITRDNYYLFSITQIEYTGRQHKVALGIFDHFWDISDFVE